MVSDEEDSGDEYARDAEDMGDGAGLFGPVSQTPFPDPPVSSPGRLYMTDHRSTALLPSKVQDALLADLTQ